MSVERRIVVDRREDGSPLGRQIPELEDAAIDPEEERALEEQFQADRALVADEQGLRLSFRHWRPVRARGRALPQTSVEIELVERRPSAPRGIRTLLAAG